MPTLCFFYGILVRMYWQDHNPPHFHARYGDDEVIINTATLEISRDALPRRPWRWFWNGPPSSDKERPHALGPAL